MPHVPAVRCSTSMAVLGLVLTLFATPMAAQSGLNLERPGHWKARYDNGHERPPNGASWSCGPAGTSSPAPARLFWDPGSFASGAYGISSTIFLFPEGDPDQSGSTRLDSPFGLFLAGSDLEADGANYLSFELRNDRHFRIAEHSAGKTRDLVPWTEHDAVVTMGAEASGPVKNVLAVDVRGDRTVFYLNDAQIAELPGDRVELDGVVGVRAGAGLSIHVTEVDIGPNRREE